jgi:hypothetical protein
MARTMDVTFKDITPDEAGQLGEWARVITEEDEIAAPDNLWPALFGLYAWTANYDTALNFIGASHFVDDNERAKWERVAGCCEAIAENIRARLAEKKRG